MSNISSDVERSRVSVAISRDLQKTKQILGAWFTSRMRQVDSVEVIFLTRPTAAGGSSELFFATLSVRSDVGTVQQKCVVRINPSHFRLFLRDNFSEQYRLLKYLEAETVIPVPSIRFYEPDTSFLGSPFWVMDNVEGQVPPDNPSYNAGGFLFKASVDQRRRLWRSGLETLAKLTQLDVSRLPRIVTLNPGESGMEENLRHWTDSMMWTCDGKPTALLRFANDWLWANKPSRGDTGLSWGDARIGNMIFRNWECAAVLDWETITLAGCQLDLAHWLVMDDYSAEGLGFERLPGLGTREETVVLWEELTGRRADQLDWHEVLAAFRLSVIMMRYGKLWAAAGRTGVIDAEGETLLSRHLRKVLARVARMSERGWGTGHG
jgi:aminoglycoside phosphotransferase (APT) family kinase protein